MDSYIGCKIIKAQLMTYGDYKLEKYGNVEYKSNISDDAKGYIVYYPPLQTDGKIHISWSPINVFENAYRRINEGELKLINK